MTAKLFINVTSLFLTLVGLFLMIIYSPSDWQATVGVMMLTQSFTGWMAWTRFKLIKLAIFPDFLSFILLYQFGTKLLAMVGLILKSLDDNLGTISENLKLIESVPLKYQFQAEVVFLLSIIVFSAVWRLQERKRIAAVWHEPTAKAAWLAYAVSLIGYLSLAANDAGVSLGAVQDLLRIFSIGAIAALLAGSSAYALGKPRGWLPIVALAPLLLLALRSGMKSEVAVAFFPLFIPIIRRMTARRFGFISVFLLFTLLFIFPFSEAWRTQNWQVNGGTKQQESVLEVAGKVTDLWDQNGIVETVYSSTAKWLARGSTSQMGGLVMSLAERDGFIGPILIEGLATIFVPRFFWPNKPTYAPGAWFTWYLGMAYSPETATSATAMMLPTELYWMFGVAGVLIGMSLLAVLYFNAWIFLLKKSTNNVIASLALFALLARSSGLEEVHTIYAISSPIILVGYVLIFTMIIRFLTLWHRRRLPLK
ncbi:hypothetical protein [Limnohabitans sp. WS1]|uniref:hypothetical protein n=1 Tax=Limnohabitans sp. WS1 TaxID=1100726 RepID=UPI000D35D8B9|nr:hypothetical protein [Limnohabitans sp. WS1]PUE17940.1 hypothetical protein B9Z48_10160 [Limnohabitans sp. WS1]